MFCPKCGNKSIDRGAFCQKCGTKLIENGTIQSSTAHSDNPIEQSGNASSEVPKKKKKLKLTVIFSVAAAFLLLFIIVAAISGRAISRNQSQEASTNVNLSKTYKNEEEGISFMYPSAWVPLSEKELADHAFVGTNDTLVLLANEMEDLPEENSYIMVSKFNATQDDIDHLFVDDEQFAETFDDDAIIEDTFTTEIDGVAARKIAYLDKDGIGCQSYFYAVAPVLYRIDFRYKGESAGNKQRFFDAVLNSYKITLADSASVSSADQTSVEDVDFPLTVSTDAVKIFDEWAVKHPLVGNYHLDLISDDEIDDADNKIFLFALETESNGIFNMSIRKLDGYMAYIGKYETMSMDDWYESIIDSTDTTIESDSLSKEESLAIVNDWLAGHQLGDCQSQNAEFIENTSDGMHKYNIICDGSASAYFIYVNPEDGSMSVEDFGQYYDSVEDWYSMVWLEEGIDSEYASDTFDRSYYLYNSIPISDFMRYPDNNLNKPCYFEQFTVDNIPEDRVYICRNGNNWIVINDLAQSLSAKALVGDMVTVYGVYDGVTSVNFTNGSTLQVPLIKADKFIDNNVLPEDTDSFLYGTIEGINRCEDAFGTGSEYLLNSYAKLAAGAEYTSDKSSLINIDVSDFRAGGKAFIGYVDGYQVWIKTELDNNIALPHELGIITFDDEVHGIQAVPVYIHGQFTNIDLRTSSVGINAITLTFHIDSFEKYQ